MDIVLNESTYFFQAVKSQVNLIWWNWYTTPHQKHCFITVKTQKNRVLSIGPSGILAVNIGRTTIHSSYRIKSGIKLLSLKDESKAALKNRLWKVTFSIINELSMVSNDLWTAIGPRLGEIFMMIPEKAFVSLSVVTVANLLKTTSSQRKHNIF